MPSYQQERDEFIALMAGEGVPVSTARKLLSAATTLQRLAELSCSSERADRDQVKCPAYRRGGREVGSEGCLCKDYGSNDPKRMGDIHAHGTVPRIAVQEWNTERRVETLCAKHGIKPKFGGDPRGAVLKLVVPSGKYNGWGGPEDGLCVPAKGYTAAQLERIG